MATLNHGKIIKALECAVQSPQQDFIWDFLKAFGTSAATLKRLRLGDGQRNAARVEGDLGVAQKLYFRAVPSGQSLHDALHEILTLPTLTAHKIRFVMVTDFTTVMAHDRKVDDSTTFDFAELPQNYEFFLPLTGLYEKAIAYAEHPADTKACEKMGRLYDAIRRINDYQKDDLHALNVFLTRLLFCFFAEDTGIFPQEQQMTLAVQSLTREDGSDVADFFKTLFTVLDLAPDSPERKTYSALFRAFPYVNGELFREKVRIPCFDRKTRRLLIDCGSMKWSDISPVIFGSMFQAVMDQDARRSLGAHYTSEKNILKVVRPLFLDALEEEFQAIQSMSKGKVKALKAFRQKLGSLTFLDPACGCGNFLIVSYRELRKLELRVLLVLKEEAPVENLWVNVQLLSNVTIEQFYGIEIEEFPVDVARVSLWLMEHVMNVEMGKTFGQAIPSIPLKHAANIICANALTTPWKDVVKPEKLNYILGNPPFVGKKEQTAVQKFDLISTFKTDKIKSRNLDYVCCWYRKSLDLLNINCNILCAFVSTNSICQGEQVAPLWNNLFKNGISINFAYKTFKWTNESKNKAAVHCIIVGFSKKNNELCRIYEVHGDNIHAEYAKQISPYLVNANPIIISSRNKPLQNDTQNIQYGSMPIPKDFLTFDKSEYDLLSDIEKAFCKKFIGGDEHLGNTPVRYCLWISEADFPKIPPNSIIAKRIHKNKLWRLSSLRKQTIKLAEIPYKFGEIRQPRFKYLLLPKISSENREYIPCSFYDPSVIASGSTLVIDNATLYTFAIISSKIHHEWMKTVGGRLEMRYQYSNNIVYNTFPWPTVSDAQKQRIESLADQVLMTREAHPDLTLAEMYDPDKMPGDLREVHRALDLAVDALYQKKPFENDEERLQLLFNLYENLVKKG